MSVRPGLRAHYQNAMAAIYLPRVPRDGDDLEPLCADDIEMVCDADWRAPHYKASVIV